MASVYSYVVRYDSGFAPNPFYGYCTLATCKPDIRRNANKGDWIIGSGSNEKGIRRGGYLVYAMRVTDHLTFDEYSRDARFKSKQPYRTGSRKQSCGDNIYFRDTPKSDWQQRDSFHTLKSGRPNPKHIKRDTGVDRVLISEDFIYFGGQGPKFPPDLRSADGRHLSKSGIGFSRFDDLPAVQELERWIRSFPCAGYQGAPTEWVALRG